MFRFCCLLLMNVEFCSVRQFIYLWTDLNISSPVFEIFIGGQGQFLFQGEFLPLMHNLSAESLLSVLDVQQRFLNLTGQNSSISPACTTSNNCSDYCFSVMLTLIIVCCPTAWNCALYISSLVCNQRLKGTHMQISGVFFLLNSLFENSSHFCLNNLFSSVRLL